MLYPHYFLYIYEALAPHGLLCNPPADACIYIIYYTHDAGWSWRIEVSATQASRPLFHGAFVSSGLHRSPPKKKRVEFWALFILSRFFSPEQETHFIFLSFFFLPRKVAKIIPVLCFQSVEKRERERCTVLLYSSSRRKKTKPSEGRILIKCAWRLVVVSSRAVNWKYTITQYIIVREL